MLPIETISKVQIPHGRLVCGYVCNTIMSYFPSFSIKWVNIILVCKYFRLRLFSLPWSFIKKIFMGFNLLLFCRSSHPHPNIFEVHTPGRVFLLSAPTEDDMQSWVGMLQTLKQYNKGTTLNREASTKVQYITNK